jgi:hypothetical protein
VICRVAVPTTEPPAPRLPLGLPCDPGFLTNAARRGPSVFKMRDVSRQKSMDVPETYVRDADLFRDHAGAGLL